MPEAACIDFIRYHPNSSYQCPDQTSSVLWEPSLLTPFPFRSAVFECLMHAWQSCVRYGGSGSTLQAPSLRLKVRASACTVSVSPVLDVTEQPTRAGNQVNVTCQVQKFYPNKLRLTWLENGNVSRIDEASNATVNMDGTYNWTSCLLVNTSAHRENVVVTCQVNHDEKPAITKTYTVRVLHQKEQGMDATLGEASTPVDWLFFSFFLLYLDVICF